MSFGTNFKNDLALLIFNNTNAANVGDATGLRGSSTAGNLYLSLHTADPSAGSQTTNEATFGSYARQAVARASGAGGWTVSGGVATLATQADFPQATSGTDVLTHAAVGVSSGSTAGRVIGAAALSATITIQANVTTPHLTTGTTFTLT